MIKKKYNLISFSVLKTNYHYYFKVDKFAFIVLSYINYYSPYTQATWRREDNLESFFLRTKYIAFIYILFKRLPEQIRVQDRKTNFYSYV